MLIVYTYRRSAPEKAVDLSGLPLDEFTSAALDFHDHQRSGTIWFGYLDGWMLTAHEEVLLRRVIRKFDCHVVSHFPLSFSQSWKNEIKTIYTRDPNGAADTHNNGSAIHDGRSS